MCAFALGGCVNGKDAASNHSYRVRAYHQTLRESRANAEKKNAAFAKQYKTAANQQIVQGQLAHEKASELWPEIWNAYALAITQGKNIQHPKLVRSVAPEYPAWRKMKEGRVWVVFLINKSGRVESVHPILDGTLPVQEDLIKVAVKAVYQWVFTPLLIDGEPTYCSFSVPIDFTFEQ